jgi:hypothetical protein|tara:strand:- start:119 stop:226 length:108 start_codon:yes stop_codon:yes gene_type:complete
MAKTSLSNPKNPKIVHVGRKRRKKKACGCKHRGKK